MHDGKGKKDRTVPLPQLMLPELKVYIEVLRELHERDIERGYAGVFLLDDSELNCKNAARTFAWQWLFPAKQLTRENRTGEWRRYHLHETHVQKAIQQVINAVRLGKRVTARTFRHSFASHLLQRNYDIRIIQELLGHSNVRTTMIYTYTVKSISCKDVKSPLDF